MIAERQRLQDDAWKIWGPYVSNRQWGNVREDYSADGNAWDFTGHNTAKSYTYRWAEEGIAGISDNKQRLCFAFSFWNKNDEMLKERFFGLSNHQGNHGEDLKEIYYYLDSSPTHSYMKMLYKYPIGAFPYEKLVQENLSRSRSDPEFEIIDTGIFDDDEYFDLEIEYCKVDPEDIFIRLTVHNRSQKDAPLVILPTIWYRNNWRWGYNSYKPNFFEREHGIIGIEHNDMAVRNFYSRSRGAESLFCENETNPEAIYGEPKQEGFFYKDGINNHILFGDNSVNPEKFGTKACFAIEQVIKAGSSETFDFRISPHDIFPDAFYDFDEIFEQRKNECQEFYAEIQQDIESDDERNVQRQAFAGLLWNKQFYHYKVSKWLKGDPNFAIERDFESFVRNKDWEHLHNKDIISMPDKWEYPWYATWDLAFHCVPFALIDGNFAKEQLRLLTKEWYMRPNGQMPAYEWNLSDVNPPVHAWATFRVFKIDAKLSGKPDYFFLEAVFQKLLLNFTWWVNRKDKRGENIFGGGFLGLDNIGAFDRNMELPDGQHLEQADGTSWMAMFALNMMRIAMELSLYNPVYEDMAIKFFEHFLYIAQAMNKLGDKDGLWNEDDGFFYDLIQLENGDAISLKLRSMVGLIPMFAVEVISHEMLEKLPNFKTRMDWVLRNKPELAELVSNWQVEGQGKKHLISILRQKRLKKILERMCDPDEFLSEYGIRSMSKCYEQNPFVFAAHDTQYVVRYTAAESDSSMFGGNSNWRGPIWFPLNFLVVESLQRFHYYFGDRLKVEHPKGSGAMLSLDEVANDVSERLQSIFTKNENGERPFNGGNAKFNHDAYFRENIFFYEYFDGDNGRGLGASHQCGWTATVAKLIQPRLGES